MLDSILKTGGGSHSRDRAGGNQGNSSNDYGSRVSFFLSKLADRSLTSTILVRRCTCHGSVQRSELPSSLRSSRNHHRQRLVCDCLLRQSIDDSRRGEHQGDQPKVGRFRRSRQEPCSRAGQLRRASIQAARHTGANRSRTTAHVRKSGQQCERRWRLDDAHSIPTTLQPASGGLESDRWMERRQRFLR